MRQIFKRTRAQMMVEILKDPERKPLAGILHDNLRYGGYMASETFRKVIRAAGNKQKYIHYFL